MLGYRFVVNVEFQTICRDAASKSDIGTAVEQWLPTSKDAIGLRSEIGIESAAANMRYKPEWVAHRIAPRAVLMVYAENDMLVPINEQLSCYAALGEPKKLVKLPNCQHYESYQFCNPEIHAIQKREVLDWYRTYL